MPGVASLLNKAVVDEKSIQLFYNTQELNLGLKLMDGNAKPSDESDQFRAKSSDHKGIIVNPSSLAVARYQGTNIAVGFTLPLLPEDKSDYTTYDVSIISPVYQPLASTEVQNKSIAFSSQGDAAWVTYITGTDKNNLSLTEYNVGSVNTDTFTGTTKILYNSKLAGYYDVNNQWRYVIYQDATSTLYEYCADTKQASVISNSNNAKDTTPLAVTLVGQNAYLYYLDYHNNICRIVKEDQDWGASKLLPLTSCDPDSDLTVTTANSTNHLFYVANGAAEYNFTHATDALIATS